MKKRKIWKTLVVSLIIALALMNGSAFAEKPNISMIMIDCNPDPTDEDWLPVQEIRGTIGPGAEYLLYAPPVWEDLVVYAHGYVSTQAPVGFQDPGLLDQVESVSSTLLCPIPDVKPSYAVAISSYSENGFAVKKGAQQTKQVGNLFSAAFGKPRRTYLVGASLGGGIVTYLIERFPSQYDGALALCGFVGGSQMQISYIADLRNVFDFLYPGVIPGDALNVPPSLDFDTQVAPAVTAAILNEAGSNLPLTIQNALLLASTEQIQLPLIGIDSIDPNPVITSMIKSLLSAIYYNIDGTNAILEKTHGRSPYDNTDTEYSRVADPPLPPPLLNPILENLNANVNRFVSTSDAEKYLNHWFTPTGELKRPFVTLHTTLDPAVPHFHEEAYEQVVALAGSSNWLIQIPVERYGHCEFEDFEVLEAFLELVTWVETIANP
jgi:pimeloyl-ACP methyl ester carboxylesterase